MTSLDGVLISLNEWVEVVIFLLWVVVVVYAILVDVVDVFQHLLRKTFCKRILTQNYGRCKNYENKKKYSFHQHWTSHQLNGPPL